MKNEVLATEFDKVPTDDEGGIIVKFEDDLDTDDDD